MFKLPPDEPEYKATVLRVLGGFQVLEFALKAYIGTCYSVISKSVKGTLHFGYSREDLDGYPLERLLNVFAKLSKNAEFVARLNRLRQARNQIAHQSLLVVANGDMYDAGVVEEKKAEYSALENELGRCIHLVLKEAHDLQSRTSGATSCLEPAKSATVNDASAVQAGRDDAG